MSGPIVRKYGFPNFEQIFGKRELQHGAEESPSEPANSPTPSEPPKPAEGTDTAKSDPGPSAPSNPGQGA